MADVFISYSRKDKEFVQILHKALSQSNYDAWVDWEDIPLTATWWQEIEAGIEAAHTCIFVISPDSVASKVCKQEIDHAAKHNKRLIPIVRRDEFEQQQVHSALAELNWLFFREGDDFEHAFQALIQAIDLDLNHVRAHTRLLVRAVEWRTKQRNASFLLRGSDLDEAEQWLIQVGAEKQPKPTELHTDYIATSRRSAAIRQRVTVGTLSALLLAAVGLGGFAFSLFGIAEARRIEADNQRQRAEEQSQEAKRQKEIAEKQHEEADEQRRLAEQRLAETKAAKEAEERQRQAAEQQSLIAQQERGKAERQTLIARQRQRQAEEAEAQATHQATVAKLREQAATVLNWLPTSGATKGLVLAIQTLDQSEAQAPEVLNTAQSRLLSAVQIAKEQNRFAGHTDAVNSVAFSPNRTHLVSGGWDNTVRLWDLQGGPIGKPFIGHTDAVNSVAFSPDGIHIVSGGSDGTVRLWDLQGKPIGKPFTRCSSFCRKP